MAAVSPMQVAGNGKEEINDTMSFLSAAWPLKLEEKKRCQGLFGGIGENTFCFA